MPGDYAPFYCEENIWRLCAGRRETAPVGEFERAVVVFISNRARTVALRLQRAAPPGETVVWDYHVVLLASDEGAWRIRDFDTRLGSAVPAREYFERTFDPAAGKAFRPLFRPMPARDYLLRFSSDRRHMRDAAGGWQKLPPPWPLIRGAEAASPHELERFIDFVAAAREEVLDIAALLARC